MRNPKWREQLSVDPFEEGQMLLRDQQMKKNREENPESVKMERIASAYEWVEMAIFSLVAVVLVFTFFFRIVGVDGESMMDTLMHQDRLILVSSFYQPDYEDIVVINRYANEPLIKRIIAMEGDTIDIDAENDQVLLKKKGEEDFQVLEEPYVHYPTTVHDMPLPVTIPEGYVFVMGDHRNNSKDSRYLEVGLVNVKDIAGKAVFRIWPLNKIGGLYD